MKKASEFQSIQEYLDALGFLVEGEYFVYGPVPTVRIHANYIDGHTPASFAKAMHDGRIDAHWGGKGGDVYQDVVRAIFAEENPSALSDMNYPVGLPSVRVGASVCVGNGRIDIQPLSPEKATRLNITSLHGSSAPIFFDGDKTVRSIAFSSQDQKTMKAIQQTERAWNSFLASPPGVSFVTNIEARHQLHEGLLSIRKELQEKTNTPHSNCITQRRLGRFSFRSTLLQHLSADELAAIFTHFVIVRAEHLWAEETFDYSAYSPLFAVCDPGVVSPVYDIIVSRGVSGITVEARRKS